MKLKAFSVLLLLCSAVFCSCSCKESELRKRISEGVRGIRIIDSHEHLAPEAERNERELSLFTNLHYAISDMWADGLDRKLADSLFSEPEASLEEKWALFAPYWENTRHTAYSRNLIRAAPLESATLNPSQPVGRAIRSVRYARRQPRETARAEVHWRTISER